MLIVYTFVTPKLLHFSSLSVSVLTNMHTTKSFSVGNHSLTCSFIGPLKVVSVLNVKVKYFTIQDVNTKNTGSRVELSCYKQLQDRFWMSGAVVLEISADFHGKTEDLDERTPVTMVVACRFWIWTISRMNNTFKMYKCVNFVAFIQICSIFIRISHTFGHFFGLNVRWTILAMNNPFPGPYLSLLHKWIHW